MLNSMILSMAMSISPAPVADVHTLDIQTTGKKRGTRRLNGENNLNIETIGRKRGTRRLSDENSLEIETIGKKRGTRRL